MAEFINTIDVLGDDAVIDSIIDRTITEFKDNTLTSVGRCAFRNCTTLKTVDLPNVTVFVGNPVQDHSAFFGCTALEVVNLPSLKTVQGNYAFADSNIPGTLSFPLVEDIGAYAFRNCKMTKAALPKVTAIGNGCFQYCRNLEVVDLSSVTSIAGPFEGCNEFKALIIRTPSICTWKVNWGLPPTIMTAKTGYIYVPRALIEDYKVATNWSTYASQFRALEDYTVDGTVTGELDESKI